MLDSSNLCSIIGTIRPDEIYNLAAQSHVKVSFEMPEYTAESTGVGTLRLLEAIRSCGLSKTTRLYQASTSELFGKVQEIPQSETTPFYPRSPYGCAKLLSHWLIINYRESYNMFCVSGILFNHESPRRGKTFVTRKVTTAVARIMAGKQERLQLGNIDSLRDWGHAKDYVRGMWMMLQAEKPEDYVLATGEQHSVRELVTICFAFLGVTIEWRGSGVNEEGVDKKDGRVLVSINPQYFRPAEVETLLGNPKKARDELKWRPSFSFYELVYDMLSYDCSTVGITVPPYTECLATAGLVDRGLELFADQHIGSGTSVQCPSPPTEHTPGAAANNTLNNQLGEKFLVCTMHNTPAKLVPLHTEARKEQSRFKE